MSSPTNRYNWSSTLFIECYNSIKFQNQVPNQIINLLQHDLINILNVPNKNETSRNKLILNNNESTKLIKFNNGDEFKLNKSFIEITILLSSQLNLDELHTAELLFSANDLKFEKGIILQDCGKLLYYQRFDYILNILGYLITSNQLNLLTNDVNLIFNNILISFEKIYENLSILNDLIDKQKLTGDINDLSFINSIIYVKKQLFNNHELLGSILFNLINNYGSNFNDKLEFYNKLINHIKKHLSDDDLLINHYLPTLIKLISDFNQSSDDQIIKIHKQFSDSLTSDFQKIKSSNNTNIDEIDLSKSNLKNFEIVLFLIFFTNFISWCKLSDSRTKKFDFKDDIIKYINLTINYGVMEKLLCITADSTNPTTKKNMEWNYFYDFRSLLQKSFPRLTPLKFIVSCNDELINLCKGKNDYENVLKLCNFEIFKISNNFNDSLLAPLFHDFFTQFIKNAAIVLTLLRDSEEDFLLSSINKKQLESEESINSSLRNNKDKFDDDIVNDDNDYDNFHNNSEKLSSSSHSSSSKSQNSNNINNNLDLDEISSRSDLERFYLAFVYTYTERPELSSIYWEDEELTIEIIGLINWGLSNNTSPLVTATFCLLLGSLTSNGDPSLKIWEILIHNNNNSLKKNDYTKISIDSIIESLNYYLNSLIENFETDLISQLKQQQKRQDLLFSSNLNRNIDSNQSSLETIIIELAEDSIIFISGFIQLISSIVKNLPSNNLRSKEIKTIAFNRFSPIIIGFLKFDNLIVSSKNIQINQSSSSSSNLQLKNNLSSISSKLESSNIIIDEENRTILINLLLNLLGDFIDDDDNLSLRYKIWDIIDRWLCQSLVELNSNDNSNNNKVNNNNGFNYPSTTTTDLNNTSPFKLKYQNKKVKINQGFQININQLSQVGNFTNLLKKLLTPLHDENIAFKNYKLLYPPDLGANYRINNQIGIWPYIEYLLLEVFAKSSDLKNDSESKFYLQSTILEIMKISINEIDWPFLNNIAPNVILDLDNLNNVIDNYDNTINFQLFIKLHHSLAIINYLFDEKAYKTLFDIISIGNEQVNENESLSSLVLNALTIVDQIMNLQDTFINRLLPTLKNKDIVNAPSGNPNTTMGFGTSMSLALTTPRTIYDNIYYHKTIGSNGVTDFNEILLFNLSSIVHFALYVGNSNSEIANLSIKILRNVSTSSFFIAKINQNSFDPIISKNRLLTIFENIDESVKIQFAFIEQLDNLEGNLGVKFNILKFLNDNLTMTKEPTVSHFLIGYEIRGGHLRLPEGNNNSVLKCLLKLLNYSLDLISEIDYKHGYNYKIDFGPAKLSSFILEIIVKLCRDSISSNITLKYLREIDDYDLFTRLINSQPKIDTATIWYQSKFNGDLIDNVDNEFISNESNLQSFFAFIDHRNLILQYLSLEIHNVESISKKEYYINLLLNGNEFLNGSPKVLNFLDILNYDFYNFESYKYENFINKYDLPLILKNLKIERDEFQDDVNNDYSNSILSKIYKVICANANNSLITKESKILFSHELMNEANKIEGFLTKYLISTQLKTEQLACLHSWVQVIQVLITDKSIEKKSDVILEVLQLILPKINDYFETDILFAEELISLCVLLFDVYEQENLEDRIDNKEQKPLFIEKLIPLFKTCINGILCSNSTPTLRSDLYILSNKFLQKNFNNEKLLHQIISISKALDKKFIDIICNDSIYSEGAPRITSIVFLESLIHLSSMNKTNFILEAMIKNNALLLLVRSIKRTDEMLSICQDTGNDSGINVETLLYELTAFKCILYLLIRIAQNRIGASQLIQNELFPILKQLSILSIDPDLGLDIKLNLNGVTSGSNDDEKDKKEGNNSSSSSSSVSINLSLDIPLSLTNKKSNNLQNNQINNLTDNTISYYEFLVPVFQLVSAILLSMGPSYKPSILLVKELMKHFNRLIVGVIKRDLLIERKELANEFYDTNEETLSLAGLKELVKLFTLLDSLVNQDD